MSRKTWTRGGKPQANSYDDDCPSQSHAQTSPATWLNFRFPRPAPPSQKSFSKCGVARTFI
ncbi:hypothetical protein LIPSTDRAFT_180459 [Lipomyces starkeyi NRRL Y-11557]|uniref:Uncharacterized protein n=1 Tax=Lipomyces starkeyi NRRL Y-11557 TaxID=675824 RepID=A0A1E3PWQ8_LIPST|nr:hypothetical protein LIPSTDRAFT_180459 [Lipomyces starkeyi NRRL Y-11557]